MVLFLNKTLTDRCGRIIPIAGALPSRNPIYSLDCVRLHEYKRASSPPSSLFLLTASLAPRTSESAAASGPLTLLTYFNLNCNSMQMASSVSLRFLSGRLIPHLRQIQRIRSYPISTIRHAASPEIIRGVLFARCSLAGQFLCALARVSRIHNP